MTTIRPLIPVDRGHLLRIVRAQTHFLDCEVEVAMEVIDGSLKPDEDYRTLVAVEHSGWISGFISYGPIPLTENRFDLYWIAVDPDSGRQGVGSLLLAAMEEQLGQAGSGHIYIDTSSTEGYARARAFYEKNGYDVVSLLKDFYREGDDRILYLKKFDDRQC
ncbi:MAG: GNAT family N-acetyltransferase [Desulfocapsaceae bacterium]|nr:GNAT family N-acetyltransferase [Desulfocapsaceae bacterium]